MTLSRRDMLKMGLLGGRPVALPLERTVRADSGPVNRMRGQQAPGPVHDPVHRAIRAGALRAPTPRPTTTRSG